VGSGSASTSSYECQSAQCIRGRLVSANGRCFMASSEATAGENEKRGFVQGIKALIPTKSERQKLIPLAVMFFCILFNYTILRDTKDVLMVTAPKSGAEVIPFIKTYVNLPAAILFTGLYAKMTDTMEPKNVFYALVIPFLAFFTAFALVIYPQRALLHPHAWIDSLAAVLPGNFAAPLAIIRNWSFAVFYVMAEMWGSVVASLLFWGLANEVTVRMVKSP
jgi:ATP:ADP antiporter, AAA family